MTLLSILADRSDAVLCIVSRRPPNSYSSSLLTKLWGTVTSAPVTTCIAVTFLFHSISGSLTNTCLSIFFEFQSVVRWDNKVHSSVGFLFFFQLLLILVVKLATVVESDQKAPFSIATTPRCREGCYSFLWIASLYPWYVPYIAEC